ncbi:MAG: tryptophan-rich sensory protein [Caldisericia bacterium]|nr:tryptophan-rich sensory protein [Caldisericia bacterium]
MKPAVQKWMNFFALLLTFIFNWLASSGLINGVDMTQAAARYEVWITPSGFTFGIWGIIYLFLLLFAIFQLQTPVSKSNHIKLIGNLFLYTCLFNILWLVTYQFDWIWVSVIVMIALLTSLLRLYANIRKDRKFTVAEKWFIKVPFSLYTAWITLATILNIASFLSKMQIKFNWSFLGVFSPAIWTIILLMVALVLAIKYLWKRYDPVAVLVFIWALVGVAHRHYTWPNAWFTQGQITILGTHHFLLVIFSLSGIAILLASLTRYYLLMKEKKKEEIY